jgi:NADH-quinone oxidoreductase subunit A
MSPLFFQPAPTRLDDYVPIAVFLALGVVFTTGLLWIARLVSPHRPTPEKLSAYEGGEQPMGQTWSQLNVQYYMVALLFMIFDVGTVFLFPWAVRLHTFRQEWNLGPFALVEMSVFVLILFFGLVYAWRKGALKWT